MIHDLCVRLVTSQLYERPKLFTAEWFSDASLKKKSTKTAFLSEKCLQRVHLTQLPLFWPARWIQMLTSYGVLRMRGYKLPPFNITKNETSQCNFSICNLCSQQSLCHPPVTGKCNITLPSALKPVTGSPWKEAVQ